MPIILHSSLTGDVNRDRAKQAGADAYVGKLNRKEIVEALKAALHFRRGKAHHET